MHGPINYDNDGISLVSADSWSDFKQYYRTQEFTLNGEFGNWNFVGGVYYFYEYFRDLRVRWSGTSRTPTLGQVVYSRGALETESYAAFGQLNYSFDDRWSVTLGGRYTSDDRSFKNEGASRSRAMDIRCSRASCAPRGRTRRRAWRGRRMPWRRREWSHEHRAQARTY